MPYKLRTLVDRCDTVQDVFSELQANQKEFKFEIKWIQEQWYYLLYGRWYYICGKLTYLDGWHYGYLNFWRFGGGVVPEYRDRDRRLYHGMRYCYTTKEYPATDENGQLIWENEEEKRLKMLVSNLRTVVGYTDPKGRRAGDSNKFIYSEYFETITHMGKNSGIISSSGDHARNKLFDEILVSGWQQLPFFMRPITASNENPAASIEFKAKRKASGAKMQDQLKSKIDFSDTAQATFYDGGKNFWLLADEGGKTKEADVYERHQQLRECVSQGAGINIIGFIGMPSTVGEMDSGGGRAYKKLCDDSKFEKRVLGGQTLTGMLTLYISCLDGLEGFVDEFGYSVIDTPTPRQAAFIGKKFGSRQFVTDKREKLLKDGDQDKYNEFVRLFPIFYKECFRSADGDIGFNTKVINERLDELDIIGKDLIRVGNFDWSGAPWKSSVVWKDDPNGKWELSQILGPEHSNRFRWIKINGKPVRAPLNPKHVTSCDPYKQEKVTSGRMSKGGIATVYDYDNSVDYEVEDNPSLWKSFRVVCTYLNRPGKTSDFYTDVFLQTIYFGSWLYPEINIADIIEFAQDHDVEGYFLYDVDFRTNKPKSVPGFYSQGEAKQSLFNCSRDYIEIHGHKERHASYLRQCKEIESMDEMTDYDLFTAVSGALKGCKSRMIQYEKPKKTTKKRSFGYKAKRY